MIFDAFLMTAAPSVSCPEVERLARALYGISATARTLSSERDGNFHLQTDAGDQYVFKVSNPAEDPVVTNFQTEALFHIAAMNPALPVQRIKRGLDGRSEMHVRFGADSSRVVRMFTYLDGVPLNTVERSAAQRRNLAQCLARIGLALRDFAHPGADHELAWDIKHASRIRTLFEYIADVERRSLTERFLDNFEEHALPVLPALRWQVIHNDLNPNNVLVNVEDHSSVAGILDFGDMVRAPLINDLAVAAAYQLSQSPDPFDTAIEFIKAYHAVLPLQKPEVEILFDLIAVRLVIGAAITGWRARCHPENSSYLLRNNAMFWSRLEHFSTFPRTDVQQRLLRACHLE